MIPAQYRMLYGLNPMAGVIEGFRWAFLGAKPHEAMLLVSVGVVVLLIGGLFYFKRMEQYFRGCGVRWG